LRPRYPALAVGVNEKREQLRALREAQPANGTVAIGGDHQPPIARDIVVPSDFRARPRFGPEFMPKLIE
jgi:hypothetical protein